MSSLAVTPMTLRRRAAELFASSQRERDHDATVSRLLLFYGVECRLKYEYLRRNNLRNTSDSNGGARAASEFKHDLLRLFDALRLSRSDIAAEPAVRLRRDNAPASLSQVHQAWRYGESLTDSPAIETWLQGLRYKLEGLP